MLELLTQSAWAYRIGWVLIHSVWQFALLAFLAVMLQRALARHSAAARYGGLLAVMAIMVAVPVATWFSPWSGDGPAPAIEVREVGMPESFSLSQLVSPSQHRDDTMALAARVARPERSDGRGESRTSAATPFAEPQGRATQGAASGFASSLSLVERRVQPWLPEIVLVWFAGVLVAALRPLLSWYTVRRLRTAGVSPVAGAVQAVLERTLKKLRFARAVELLQSALVKTPVVVGYFRPAILLPLCVVTGLPETQLELILAHELAHIRRHDYLINLLQTLIETLFFYHPAVWWLSRQIRNERENCCDDVAMATVGSRADYGRALLAIEELRARSTALSVAACGGSLLARIRRIAGCEPAPRTAGGASILCVILLSIAVFAAVAWATAPADKKPASDMGSDSKNVSSDPMVVTQQQELRKKVDRKSVEPSAPRAITKPENKTGQSGVPSSGKAPDQGGGRFHLVRGNTTWIGSDGAPLAYDDYDKNCYSVWGAHTVVLPKHVEGFWDFYSQRTLDPGIGRMDVSRVHPPSESTANIVVPGAIDLPAYQLLLQPSAQRALNLSAGQRTKLQDISTKYWPERRKIAGKELDDMEAISQRELAAYSAKAGHGVVQSGDLGSRSPFSKEVVEKLERQWTSARKQIEDVLTPEQLRTLKDLTFRTFAFGSGAMFEPEVLGRLGLAKTRQDELRALELQLQKEKDRRLRSVTREKMKKMLAVLTPQQVSQLREKHSPDKNSETDCSMYPYPGLPSQLPDSGAAEVLGFSAEQRERVRKIVTTHWMTLTALDQEKQKLPLGDEKARKAIDEKRRQEMADLRKQIEAALTPEQWASCKEMAFENLGIPWLRRVAGMAQVPGEMGLTERLRMGAVMAIVFNGMGLSGQQLAALRTTDAEYSDKPEQIYCELTDKAIAAFTPAQQEQLRAEVDRRGW